MSWNSTTQSTIFPSISSSSKPLQHSYWEDWILYTVPGSAFLLGLCLFSLVLKTQARRRAVANKIECDRGKQAKQSLNGIISDSVDAAVVLQNAKSVETLSYENVEVGIYESQDAVTQFSVHDQEDYMLPDEDHDGTQGNCDNHHAVQPLTESESYENMVCLLYASTMKRKEQPFEGDDEDYIDPGQMVSDDYYMQHSESLNDIDAESYVDMDPQHEIHPDFHPEEDDYIEPGQMVSDDYYMQHSESLNDIDAESYVDMDPQHEIHPDFYPEEDDLYEKMASVDIPDETEGVWQDQGSGHVSGRAK